MKKAVFISSVASMIDLFNRENIEILLKKGYEIHIIANFSDGNVTSVEKMKEFKNELDSKKIQFYDVAIDRQLLHFNNVKAYREIKKLIKKGKYSIIHCQTPIGGGLARLAARKDKNVKVIYTAHGFHFYKNAPIKSWLIYYPFEKVLSKYTDTLITINEEDYQLAKNRQFHSKHIEKTNGVGIDLNKFKKISNTEKTILKEKYCFKEDDFIITCVAELNENKHQDLLIAAMGKLKKSIPNAKLLLIGKAQGSYEEIYRNLAKKLGLENQVLFLGYRKDINSLLNISDLAVLSSIREGLPVNILEAMAVGLPLVVNNCRGSRDLVENGVNGYLVEDNALEFALSIEKLYFDYERRIKFGEASQQIIKKYDIEKVKNKMEFIYDIK